MTAPAVLLALSLASGVVGAAVSASLVGTARRVVFFVAVAAACLSAQATAVAVLAGAATPALHLWTLPELGAMRLALDPLSALFALVTALVFLVGAPYALAETAGPAGSRRGAAFVALYQLLFVAMLLVLAAGGVITFLVAWEVMSLLLYGLVMLGNDGRMAPGAAYRMVAMGETGMVAGAISLILLAGAGPHSDFDTLRQTAKGFGEGKVTVIFLLGLLGFGLKAGFVPLNQWLPDAYVAAPRGFRPVLAGTTTNLGIYAIARIGLGLLPPVFALPGLIALAVGGVTALVGILYATIQSDLRRLLAHSSIENMGIVIAMLGAAMVFDAGGHAAAAAMAVVAAFYHMTNHSLYKALLFTGAGCIETAAGSDMDRLGGLMGRMPSLGLLFLVGTLAIAALPPMNGFVSEWLALETMLRAAILSSAPTKVVFALSGALLALAAGLAVTCFVKAFAMTFLGPCRSVEAKGAVEVPGRARGSMATLALVCVLLGVLPTYVIPVLDRAAGPVVSAHAVDSLVPQFFRPDATGPAALPPDFRAEFRDLGAEVGAGLAPGRGLIVMHRGGEKNPVVFAMSTAYMAAVLALLLVVIWVAFRLVAGRRAAARAVSWDGGLRKLRPDYTYSATGFSNPVRVVFHALLRPRTVEDTTKAVAEHFRTAVRRVVSEAHPSDRLVLNPLVSLVGRLADLLRRMHHGPVNAYAAYVLVVLLLSLIAYLDLTAGPAPAAGAPAGH